MRAAKVVVTVAVTVAFTPLSAQVGVGLGVGSGVGQIGTGAWLRESRVSPSLRYDAPVGFLRLDASALERAGALSLDHAAIDAALSSPALGPLRLDVTGQFRESRFDSTRSASVGSALSLKHRGSGVWVGTTHERDMQAGFQLGAWQIVRSALVSLSSRSRTELTTTRSIVTVIDSFYSDTAGWQKVGRNVERTQRTRSRPWSDVEGRLDWSGGRLTLSAVMTRSNLPRTQDSLSQARSLTWGSINTTLRINPRVSLITTVGTLPTTAHSDALESRYATLGFRFAHAALLRDPPPAAVRPAATAFRLLPVEPGVYRVVLRSPAARTVEISGDFNQWKPVALTQTSPDVWEVTLPLAAGTYRLNVRVNGDAWTAPPGLPAVDDEFSGRVGLLVVK